MRYIIKKLASVLLTLLIVSTSVVNVFAQTNSNGNVRTNIKFEKGSIEELFETNDTARINAIESSKKLVYTYMEDGEMYRVYDEVNNNLTYSNSAIFRLDANGKEIPVRTETVNVKDNIVTTTINQNGNKTVDVLDLNEDKDIDANSSEQLIRVNGTWDGYPVSNTYEEWGTFNYSKSITGTTVASVTIIINAIVKYANINPYASIAVTSISGIVNYIVQKNVKRAYYKEEIAYRYTQIPNAYVQQKAVERTRRTFYTDSNYATSMGSATTYVYSKYYKG
ncbi:hypothetical protein [Clostridium sp. Marseille-P2415]|uniref:hypothetical protein n=1 Tax=Clostridium sp. Marseille-P2415 TaxID=1805471 RepID=UPI0009883BAB|nr:hypothetical protein [Clostridium sp. Marseille-P2415]